MTYTPDVHLLVILADLFPKIAVDGKETAGHGRGQDRVGALEWPLVLLLGLLGCQAEPLVVELIAKAAAEERLATTWLGIRLPPRAATRESSAPSSADTQR